MRGDHEYVHYTKNFFSNIFNTRLHDAVSSGPINTEGWRHLLHHEAAKCTVMSTWSWKGAYRLTDAGTQSSLNIHQAHPCWLTLPPCKEPSAINIKTIRLFLNVLQILIYHNLHSQDHNLPQNSQSNLEFQSDISLVSEKHVMGS